jgi:large subunit ribosomal protein L29|tara:strand:- start:1828 stop:2046 length:219 start_codon:yes stop_codon:yes gene_type:complete
MTKVAELRELPSEQLEERVRDLDDQVFRLRLQKSMGQTEAVNKMKDIRRDRARAKTLLREREIEAMRVEADG